MESVQSALDAYAGDAPYAALADAFLEFERYTGREATLLVAEAAAASTGQPFTTGVKPAVEAFRDAFVEPGRADTFADLAGLDPADGDLVDAFGAERKRHVLQSIAEVLADRPESDDFDALRGWAAEADVYRYETDPIGEISGVGPATFQYLRILAGVDTIKPGPAVDALIESVADDLGGPDPDRDDPLETVAYCEWLSAESSFRRLEIDRLAWWRSADADEREAVLPVSG